MSSKMRIGLMGLLLFGGLFFFAWAALGQEQDIRKGGGSANTNGVPLERRVVTTAPLTGGGDLNADRTIALPKATAEVDGYLGASDWVLFSAKQDALGFVPLTPDQSTNAAVEAAGAAAAAATNELGSAARANTGDFLAVGAKAASATVADSAATVTGYLFPGAPGVPGVLTNDGAGNLSWAPLGLVIEQYTYNTFTTTNINVQNITNNYLYTTSVVAQTTVVETNYTTVLNVSGKAQVNYLEGTNTTVRYSGTNVALRVYGAVRQYPTALSYDAWGTNVLVDWQANNFFTLLLTNNAHFVAPTNLAAGQTVMIELRQDDTGNRAVSWDTGFWKCAGGTAPTITSAAGSWDVLTAVGGMWGTNAAVIATQDLK